MKLTATLLVLVLAAFTLNANAGWRRFWHKAKGPIMTGAKFALPLMMGDMEKLREEDPEAFNDMMKQLAEENDLTESFDVSEDDLKEQRSEKADDHNAVIATLKQILAQGK